MDLLKLGTVFFSLVVTLIEGTSSYDPYTPLYAPDYHPPVYDPYYPQPSSHKPFSGKLKNIYKPKPSHKSDSYKPKNSYKPDYQPSYVPDYKPAPSYKPEVAYKPAPHSYKPTHTYKFEKEYDEDPKPYAFDYGVKDDYTGAQFGHKEKSNGQEVKGSYSVALPDGRIQTVKYKADHENGYQAEVSYEGEPVYPVYKAGSSHHRPSYYPKPSYDHDSGPYYPKSKYPSSDSHYKPIYDYDPVYPIY